MHVSDAVFAGALAILFGVAAASLELPIVVFSVSALVFSIFSAYLLGWLNLWKHVILFSVLIFFGAFYYNFYLNVREARTNLIFNEDIKIRAVVAGEPRVFDEYQILNIDIRESLAVRSSAELGRMPEVEPLSGKIKLFAPPLADLNYGDLLEINGVIEPPEKRTGEPILFFPQIEVAGKHLGNPIKEKLLAFKGFLVGQFRRSLPPDESALLSGVTFGVRSDFSESFREAMASSGTTHIVALSGYNITVLVLAIAYVFGSFLSRRKTFYITVGIIFLFVLMVGGEPSVVRAAIMGFLALLAGEVGRIYSVRNAIALTALVMAFFDPTVLTGDVGFQLSFASLLGIVYLSPILKNIFHVRNAGFLAWKENAALTASAQFMVLPIIVMTFGEFSLTAVAANVLILAFIPLTMFLGFFLAASSSIYSFFGFFAAKLVGVLLTYEIRVIDVFASLRLPIKIPPISEIIFIILYYTAAALLIYYFNAKNKEIR